MENTSCAVLLAGTILCVFAIPAHAQDTDAMDWTGYYLGLHAGERWSSYMTSGVFPGLATVVESSGAAVGGLQFGYDRQFGNWALGRQSGRWLLGAESDFDVGKQSRSETEHPAIPLACLLPPGTPLPPPPGTPCLPTPVTTLGYSVAALSDMSARIRAGLIWRRWLLYATGGLALAHVRVRAKDTYLDANPFHASLHCESADPECSVAGSDDKILVGWTVGLGSEVSVSRDVSIALEYRHSAFGHQTFRFMPIFSGNGAQFLGTPAPRSLAPTDDRATLRLNYRFNGS